MPTGGAGAVVGGGALGKDKALADAACLAFEFGVVFAFSAVVLGPI